MSAGVGVLAVMDRLCMLATDKGAGGHEAREARAAVAEHVRLLKRVQYVRGLTGNARAQAWDKLDREIDAALARCGGAS